MALTGEAAPDQNGQLLRQVQTKARTLVAPCRRRVELRERLEQTLHVFRADAAARVFHGNDLERSLPNDDPARYDNHLADFGELDRVANEIDDDLTQSAAVGP